MPEAKDGRVGFVAVDDNFEFGFEETINWRDDNVEGEDDEVIFLTPPLEIVLRPDLDGGRMGEGGGDNGFVISDVEQLGRSETFALQSS